MKQNRLFKTLFVLEMMVLGGTRMLAQEPYAAVSVNDNSEFVLTFYYDDKKAERDGLDVGPFEDSESERWGGGGGYSYVVFDDSFAACTSITSTAFWFADFQLLKEIKGIENLNTSNVTDMHAMFNDCRSLITLDLSSFNTSKVTDMSGMFSDCFDLVSIDLSHFDTSNVTDMSQMFYRCEALLNLDVSHFDTSNVTDMSQMFYRCEALINLDVSHFNTSKVTNMIAMFEGCSSLTSLDVSHFDTSNVTEMGFSSYAEYYALEKLETYGMFSGCSSLTSLDVSHFDTSKVTNMGGLFDHCSSLTSIDVTNFDTGNVESMTGMFRGCSSLTDLDLSNFNTSKVMGMTAMFDGCSSLANIDVSHFVTQELYNSWGMFRNCSSLTSIDLSSFQYVQDDLWVEDMFTGCSALTTVYASDKWQLNSVLRGDNMFTECIALVGGAGTHFDPDHADYTYARIDGGPNSQTPGYLTYKNASVVTDPEPYAALSDNNTVLTFYYDDQKAARNGMSVGPFEQEKDREWNNIAETITTVVFDSSFDNCTTITSTAYWFYGMYNLSTITGLEHLNTQSVTDMSSMFESCKNLTSLDLRSFDTSNVIRMEDMFRMCESLTNIDLSSFNTANVERMGSMFCYCSALTTIDVSGFNTENVRSMGAMFGGCSSLISLDLRNFNTANVMSMNAMFEGCSGLINLDVSSFNTSKVIDMSWMFRDCSSLINLNLSNFNTSNVQIMTQMFCYCKSLKSLDLSSFNTSKVTSMTAMFYGCSSLTSLNISSFDISKLTDLIQMFANCKSMTSFDISNFNTENITKVKQMFSGCSGMTSIDLSNFNTAEVTDMSSMFEGCSSLKKLDLSKLTTSNVTNMGGMFNGCSGLKTVYVDADWTTSSVTEDNGTDMFSECINLVGGAGTVWDANHVDYTYAHIDEGPNNPGYFTLNPERVKNGNVEGEDYSSFAISYNLQVQELTQENIVEDSERPGNKCIKVVSLENPEEPFHSQFMIRIGEPMKTGQKFRFSMDYKASKEVFVSSQVHTEPGEFLHLNAIGDFAATPEWQTHVMEGEVSDDINGFKTIVFNLSHEKSSTEFFFDNISFKVDGYDDAPDIAVDLIENGDMEGENNSSYWYRNNQESTVPDTAAITNGVGVDGSRGIKIEASAKQEEIYNDELWFSLNQPVSEGTRFRLSYDARADREAKVYIGAHGPANFGDFIGDWMEPYALFNTEWQTFTTEGIINSTVSSDQKPLASLAFSLNVTPETNNYYFDNVKFEVILEDQCPKPTFTQNFNTVYIQSPFDAKIYYTTDGTEPNTHSAVYTEPLALTQATTIKAMAIVEGKDASPVATYAFEVMPEPYTVLSDNNTKVTFYYDKNRAEREGIVLGTSDEWGDHVSEITTAVIDSSFVNYTSLTSTARWFNRLSNLKTITGLDKVKTDNVRDMEAMFAECSSLTDLDVSTFVTKNVKNMRYMFYNCSGMRRLDLTNFNTGKLTDMYRMFNGCFAMRVIFAGPDWTPEKVTSGAEVFNDCTNIVGGETTTYSTDHTDYTYARIDGGYGTDKAGYFTLKEKFEAKKLMLQDQLAYIMNFVEKTAHVLLEKDPEYKADELWVQYKELQSLAYAVHEEIYIAENSIDLLKCEDYLAYIMATADKWAQQVEEYQPGTPGEWHDGDEFTDITAEGITMTFRIISVAQNTCQVGGKPSSEWGHASIDVSTAGHVTIPEKAKGFDVIAIGEQAFWTCEEITSVDIPNSITSIDASAFEYCKKLAKADLPANLKSIGAYAFYGCAFTSVVIPSSVREIGEDYNWNPFTACPNIQSITVEAGNEVFDSRENCNAIIHTASNTIFTGCGNTVILRSVKAIANHAFYGCKGLTSLTLLDNISSIGSQSFAMCSNLATIQVELGNPVYDSRIGCNAIIEKATNKLVLGCKNTFVPTSVTTIGDHAFMGSGIAAINIPENVKNIEGYAFTDCEALSSVRLPSELTEIGMSVFYGCSSLKSIDIPETVTTLGACAFQSSGLESIVIPSNVTTIGFQGFLDNSNLQSITFGQNVSDLGYHSFSYCDNIRTIYSYIKTPPVATEAHFGSAVYEQATLYVPYGTRERYLAMDGWNQFQNIVEMPNTEPEPYGVLTGNNTTLRLYYDEQRDIRKGMLITPTMTREPWYEQRGSIMRVVVDETYASNMTEETKFWLSDYPMLAAVQAGNAEIPAAQYRGIQNPNVLVYVNEDRLAPEGIQNVVVNGVAQEIVLKDASGNNNWYCPQAFQAEKISYSRNFKQQTRIGYSRGWESLALPFAVQTITHQDKGVIAPFGSDASDLHFWLRRLTHSGLQAVQTIEANTPYIISMPNSYEYPERFNLSGQVTFAAENVTVPQTVVVMDESEEFIMAPAFQSMAVQPDIYALNVGEKREFYPEGSVFERNYRGVRPFEAYTMHKGGTSPAPMYFIIGENTDDNTTDILEVRSQMEDGNGEWFTLDGRKLQNTPTTKGVYIQNGRKVIVK